MAKLLSVLFAAFLVLGLSSNRVDAESDSPAACISEGGDVIAYLALLLPGPEMPPDQSLIQPVRACNLNCCCQVPRNGDFWACMTKKDCGKLLGICRSSRHQKCNPRLPLLRQG